MANTENEWNDPPSVSIEDSPTDEDEDGTRSTNGPTQEEADSQPRGPFSGLRRVLNFIFWGGLILAAAVGAFTTASGEGFSPVAGGVKLVLAFFVTIGWWVAAGWWVAWAIDKVLVYMKHS